MRTLPVVLISLLAASAAASELPDSNLTPGATDPEVTPGNVRESICAVRHFTWTEGHAPPESFMQNLARDLIKQYGYSDENLKHYQMDHLIPLALGGNPTDPKNIWPQPLIAKWSARRKDYLEQIMHAKVCRGEIGLVEAQNLFRSNWIEAYKAHVGDIDQQH